MFDMPISSALLFIALIIIILLIIACIVYIIYKDKAEDRKEMDKLLDDVANAKPREKLINSKIEVPIGEDLPKKIVDEVNKSERLDLDSVLNKMQENLNKQEDIKEKFEEEQEENSVISYTELMENMKDENFKNDVQKYEEEQEKSTEELTKEKVKEFLLKEEKEKTESNDKKFQTTDFISPVFGKMNAEMEYPTVKSYEQKAKERAELKNYKHANVASDKNAEFLQNLKDFRSNL